ncbi:MAG: translin family protein [Candidatus Thorarchaeota archaeon]
MDFEKSLGPMRVEIEADDAVREKTLPLARGAVRKCSQSIKEAHRGDFEASRKNLEEAHSMIIKARDELEKSSFMSKSRVLDTAYQELTEAANVISLLEKRKLTPPEEYGIPSRQYLTGLADTIGELRRAILDALRTDKISQAEEFLVFMEDIHEELVAFDFPNALIPDLRRKCDVARGIIERTRGDLTTAVRQSKLISKLGNFEESMKRE